MFYSKMITYPSTNLTPDLMAAASIRYASTYGVNIFTLKSGRFAIVRTPGRDLLAICDTFEEIQQVYESEKPFVYKAKKAIPTPVQSKAVKGLELDLSSLGL